MFTKSSADERFWTYFLLSSKSSCTTLLIDVGAGGGDTTDILEIIRDGTFENELRFEQLSSLLREWEEI